MSALSRAALVLVLLAGVPLPAAAATQGSAEKTFAPGQRVWMDLSAGNYTIRAGRDDQILVRWESNDPDAAKVRVDIEVRGPEATIVSQGPSDHYRVTIELPARTDLTTRLSAGELTILGITGNKDVHSWAGNITIDVVRPDDYRSVSASVTAGEINARPFDVFKGGLFRSFSWKGPGSYTLKVSLTAGDLRFQQ
jgi:hypothetical protein